MPRAGASHILEPADTALGKRMHRMIARTRQRATRETAPAGHGSGAARATRGIAPILLAAIVALAALAAYWPILRNGFTYDDAPALSDNALLPALLHPATYFGQAYFVASGEATYRPLVSLSYGLEYAAWGRWALSIYASLGLQPQLRFIELLAGLPQSELLLLEPAAQRVFDSANGGDSAKDALAHAALRELLRGARS